MSSTISSTSTCSRLRLSILRCSLLVHDSHPLEIRQSYHCMLCLFWFNFVTWGIPTSTDWEQGQRVLNMANDALFYKNKKRALETASLSQKETDQPTVVPSAYGAKVLNNLDTLVKEYENSVYTKEKTFIGEVADALGIPREKFKDKSSQYAAINSSSTRRNRKTAQMLCRRWRQGRLQAISIQKR